MKRFLAWLLSLFTVTVPAASPLPAPSPSMQSYGQYRYVSVPVVDQSRLKLFSNLSNRQSAEVLVREKGCGFLVNAGFYDTDNRHLGWFNSQGEELNPEAQSRLFDGFIFSQSDQAQIGFSRPQEAVWGMQSGPVLIYEGQPLKLNIKNDQPRRRVIAGLKRNQELFFVVILSPESDYAGPLLKETPPLVKGIEPETVTAINLDGGSASAFMTPEVALKEYQPIGGYFCYTGL